MSTGGGREIRAGKAFVELGLRNQLGKGLARANAQLRAFSVGVMQMGLKLAAVPDVVFGALQAATLLFAKMGSDAFDASQRIGVTVETLTALQYAAEQTGVASEGLEAGLRGMFKTIGAAKTGNKTAIASLKAVGLTVGELEKLNPEQQLLAIADGLAKIENPAERAALAMRLLGKSGMALLPLLNNGRKGIEEMTARARELGIVMSKEDAEAADALGDVLDDLWKQVKFGVFQVGAALAPAMTEFAKRATQVASSAIAWLQANRGLVVSFTQIVGILAAVSTGIVALGASGLALSLIFSGLGVFLSAGLFVLKAIAAAFAAIVSPVGLVIVALAAVAASVIHLTGIGQMAVDYLMGLFDALAKSARQMMQGIADAIVAGNVMLAAEILWAGLQLLWLKGTQDLSMAWVQVQFEALRVFDAIYFGAAQLWNKLSFGFLKFAISAAAALHEHLGIGSMTEEMAEAANFALGVAEGVEAEKIRQLEKAAAQARRDGFMGEAKAIQDEILAAQKRLDALKAEAAEKRKEFEGRDPAIPELPAFPGFEGLSSQLKSSAKAVGSFGGSAGFLGQSAATNAFKGVEDRLDDLIDKEEELVRIVRDNELAFT